MSSGADAGGGFEARKRGSALQVLFKAARLVNEEAIRRVRLAAGDERVRVAHTAIFPHVPFEGIRLTALAERLGISKQAVKELVDELESMGALERAADPADGRAKLIRWTAAGRAGLAQGIDVLDALAEELGALVGANALARTHRALLTIADHLEARAGGGAAPALDPGAVASAAEGEDREAPPPTITRGDLFWAAPDREKDVRIAHPHVVVQDDVFNRARVSTTLVCALSTNLRRAREPGNVLLDPGEGGLPRASVVVVSQISSVEKERLGARIGSVSGERVEQILAGLRFQQRSFFRGPREGE